MLFESLVEMKKIKIGNRLHCMDINTDHCMDINTDHCMDINTCLHIFISSWLIYLCLSSNLQSSSRSCTLWLGWIEHRRSSLLLWGLFYYWFKSSYQWVNYWKKHCNKKYFFSFFNIVLYIILFCMFISIR